MISANLYSEFKWNIFLDSPLNSVFKYSHKSFFRQTAIERSLSTFFSMSTYETQKAPWDELGSIVK
jgi:hypothetical protein